eukprot:GFUD01029173.1.p1 GENE.GFUD01029173.1~~GFUD01029173.1.p1  ORF type:complete len:363 (-),score=96.39 GFUD01029173.1:4-1092(-)
MERFFSMLWNSPHSINLWHHYYRRSGKLIRLRSLCTHIPQETPTLPITPERTDQDHMDWLNLSHLSLQMDEKDDSVSLATDNHQSKMSLRWDPDSGQFSLTQGSQLETAAQIVRELAQTNPDSVAIIWRKDQPMSEEMATYSQLNHMIEHIVNIIDEKDDNSADKTTNNLEPVTLIYLPVSILAVAAMLACASIQHRHSLVFAGFSSDALSSLMESGQVECVISSDHWPQLTRTLHTAVTNWPQIRTINLDVDCGFVSPCIVDQVNADEFNLELSGMEGEDLSPLFALYTGGETSVIAGLKEEAGYYQVTSNVGLTPVDTLPPCGGSEGALYRTPEQEFKEGKKKNTYRLDYINKMLPGKQN